MKSMPSLISVFQDTIKQMQLHNDAHESKQTTQSKRRYSDQFCPPSTSPHSSKKHKPLGREQQYQKKLSANNIKALRAQQQLTSHCMSEHQISISELAATHRQFVDRPQHSKLWLLEQARTRVVGQLGFKVSINSMDQNTTLQLCNLCFASLHGTSLSNVNRAIRDFKDGVVRPVPAKFLSPSVAHLSAVVWINDTIKIFGDYMPDRLSVVLPVVSKQELFSWYASDNANFAPGESPPYKYHGFLRLLAAQFPHVEFRKHKRFMQCTYCNQADNLISMERVSSLFISHFHMRYKFVLFCYVKCSFVHNLLSFTSCTYNLIILKFLKNFMSIHLLISL